MCTSPEDRAAAPAAKESLVEFPGLGRHMRSGEIAGDDFEGAAATHAAGLDQGKIQTAQNKSQLLITVQLVRNEKSGDSLVADDVALHDAGVAG